MNLEIRRQGNEFVVVPIGQSPLKFTTEHELAEWLINQPQTDTHPGGQPNPNAQAAAQADKPTDTKHLGKAK